MPIPNDPVKHARLPSTSASTKSVTCSSKFRQTTLPQYYPSKRTGEPLVQRKTAGRMMQVDVSSCTASSSRYYYDDDSRDSGIGCDSICESSMSSSSWDSTSPSSNSSSFSYDSLFISTTVTGPTNFSSLQFNKPSPDLPVAFADKLNPEEVKAVKLLESATSNNPAAAVSRKRTPLKDLTNIRRPIHHTSPISRNTSFRQQNERKRTFLNVSPEFDMNCKKIKQIVDENAASKYKKFHRTFSTSQLETSSHFDEATEFSYSLSIAEESKDVAFGRIENSQMLELLKDEKFDEKYLLIDCRYPYEYNGGHIKGAINVFDPQELWNLFYPKDEAEFSKVQAKKPIFYCEFSSVRGPKMANMLRRLDRHRNMDSYPRVDYSEIYVLGKGYNKFYEEVQMREYCCPPEYIKMTSKTHLEELRKYHFHKKTRVQGFGVKTQSMLHLTTRSAQSSPSSSPSIFMDLNGEFTSKCLLSSPCGPSVKPIALTLEESPLMS